MSGLDFNEPPWDVESGLGRYSDSWNAFHASPHARAQENLFKWGVKGLNAAVLAGGGTILSLGMNPPGAPQKRKRKSIKSLRGSVRQKLIMPDGETVDMTDSSGNAPTAGPTVNVQPSRVYVTNIGELGKRKVSLVVGNRDAIPEECAINFNVRGWKINKRDWRYTRMNYSPIEMVIGNLLTTRNAGTGGSDPPTWITTTSTGAQSDDGNYFNGVVYIGKLANIARATLQIKGQGSDSYADFCVPVVPLNSYGERDIAAVSDNPQPFGALDLFRQFRDGTTVSGGMYDISMAQAGANPYALYKSGVAEPGGDLGPTASDVLQDSTIMRGFMKVLTEFVIVNNSAQTMHYEINQVIPKAVHRTSPLSDLIFSYTANMQEREAFDTDGFGFVRLEKSPEDYIHWRKKWRFHRRRVVCAPGQVVRVRMYTPLSQVSRDTCLGLLGGETNTVSVPGLTQWLWVRAHGITGCDAGSHKVGVGQGQFVITMHQKVTAWYCKPHIKKMLNLVDKPFTEVITPDERQAIDDNETL